MLVDHSGPLSGYHVPGLLCARKFVRRVKPLSGEWSPSTNWSLWPEPCFLLTGIPKVDPGWPVWGRKTTPTRLECPSCFRHATTVGSRFFLSYRWSWWGQNIIPRPHTDKGRANFKPDLVRPKMGLSNNAPTPTSSYSRFSNCSPGT